MNRYLPHNLCKTSTESTQHLHPEEGIEQPLFAHSSRSLNNDKKPSQHEPTSRPTPPQQQTDYPSQIGELNSTLELHPDSLSYLKSKLSQLPPLTNEASETLSITMAASAQKLAVTLIDSPLQPLLLNIIDAALNQSLSHHSFSSRDQYIELKRELEELSNLSENSNHLKTLFDSLCPSTCHSAGHSNDQRLQLTNLDRALIEKIDWPGPLMLALSMYAAKAPNQNRLSSAIETFCDLYSPKLALKMKQQNLSDSKDNPLTAALKCSMDSYLKSRNQLVERNLRLVFHIAKRYASDPETLSDLFQEGNIGLIRAVEKYRASSNFRFSTYAFYWIESKISRGHQNRRSLIRISHENNILLGKATRIMHNEKAAGKRCTLNEIAKRIGIAEKKLSKILLSQQASLSMDALREDMKLSLHATVPDIESDFTQNLSKSIVASNIIELIDQHLGKRSALIIKERFGLLDGTPKTLRSISEHLGLSRERVRQLEKRSLKLLNENLKIYSGS